MKIFRKVTFRFKIIFVVTVFKFYSHFPHFFISLDENHSSDDEKHVNIGREPLASITTNNNIIHNNTLDEMTGSYANVNRIRNNTLDGSNEATESYSRLHLNTAPHPNRPNNNSLTPTPRPNHPNNTLTPTPRSNNTHNNTLTPTPNTYNSYTRFNDNDDVFRLNTTNMLHLLLLMKMVFIRLFEHHIVPNFQHHFAIW